MAEASVLEALLKLKAEIEKPKEPLSPTERQTREQLVHDGIAATEKLALSVDPKDQMKAVFGLFVAAGIAIGLGLAPISTYNEIIKRD